MANEKTLQLTMDNFNKTIAQGITLVDFWAEWCGPCKMIAPVLEQLSGEVDGKLKICKLNVDENSETPGKYGVMSIPTLVIFKDGQEKDRIIGYHSLEELKGAVEPYL